MRALDLTNRKIGRLTFRWPVGRKDGRIVWLASCECGTLVLSTAHGARTTQSCGCLRNENALRHGHRKDRRQTQEYQAYHNALQRCTNPKAINYKDYGGRGIEFRFTSFEEFLAAAGPKPDRTLTIDRIENNGHYERGNVRWATRTEQIHNRPLVNQAVGRTQCIHGHPLSGENLRINRNGTRHCKICGRATCARWYARHRARG